MFSRDAKDEVAGVPVQAACCAATFVRGFMIFGNVEDTAAGPVARISSSRASAARAIIAAARVAGIDAHTDRARSGRRFSMRIPLAHVVRNGFGAAHHGLPVRACCRRTLLRAAFLSCGSVSDPSRGTHLEFFCRSDAAARFVCDLVGRFGLDASIARRRGRPLVYVKHGDAVSMLLGLMGANHAVLRLADQRAVSQTKNSIRRTVNSETANAARAAASAARQRDAALRALATVRTPKMSPALREAARLRIAFPTRTLRELARAARPPISKAAMASRLRLLERMAER
ncbi:MAG: DNA-binding protein WhiA [Candidatus Eremiobacteraeota bacterium]|nr:DNA-binding protein WhiA [Candidatus Eremiobacteraeota bacterium]